MISRLRAAFSHASRRTAPARAVVPGLHPRLVETAIAITVRAGGRHAYPSPHPLARPATLARRDRGHAPARDAQRIRRARARQAYRQELAPRDLDGPSDP